jgi:hypothetical protein
MRRTKVASRVAVIIRATLSSDEAINCKQIRNPNPPRI